MKKSFFTRITAVFLAASFVLGLLPANVYAAEIKNALEVTNVDTHIAFWGGTHYFTYTINGVDYDSRTAGTQMNLNAFRAMNKDDKKDVYEHYYPGTDRTEQFGEAGVQEICDYINDVQGNTHAWKVMHDRAQFYCKDLMPYYGGVSAEDDPDRYYNQEYERLNTFTGDAQKLIGSYYMNEPEAQAFREKYGMMNSLMATGKQAYDNCVNHNEFARNAAVKATSAWLIKFIVENTIVPGLMAKPSATAAGVDSAMNTVYDQVLGMISEITDAENVSVSVEGNLVNMTIGKMGGQNISLKKGAEIVKYMRALADKNYELAKYTHEKAVDFHDQLESEAAEVIRKIEEREKKQEEAQKKEEKKKAENDKKADTSEVKPNTERYSGIKEPSYSDDDYNKKQEEYKNKLIQAAKALDEEVAALYSQMLSNAESAAKNAGYYVKEAGSESPDGDYVQFEGSSNWLTRINTEADTATYNAINSETEYKNRPKLYDADILLKNNCVIKINTLESSLNGVTDRYSVLYKELYARRKALGEKGAYNYYSADWSNWNKVEYLFEKINRVILEQASVRVNLENGFEQYEKKHKYNMESYENYKAQLQEKLDDYLTAQTNFGLACAMYSDVAKKQRELAQSGLPDYVYTQKFQSYTATVLLADGSNTALETKINAASDKNKFFKDEARKLEECMDKAALYEKQKEVAYNYAKYYLRELADIDHDGYELWSGSMGYLNADMFGNYGIDPKEFVQYREMENELKALYKANYTSADILGPIESCKALYRDFTGTGTYHNMFLQRYNEMVIKAPYYKRKIQSGELSINSFNYYYADVLMEPYNALESKSRAVSYTGTYTDIETGNEKAFRYMLYGSNGILDDIRSLEFNKNAYIPVVSVTKQGASSGGAADITLAQGGSGVLKVSVQPQNADERGVIWYSEDDSKAVVDQSGKVTGIGEGSTTICAAAKDAPFVEVKDDNGNITGYTCPDEYIAKFTVNVTDEIIEEVYKFGDADADNAITARDASFILQKTLLSTFKLPIQKKTDDWMDYVDVDADTKVTANDAAFVLQKTLVSTFELPVEKK